MNMERVDRIAFRFTRGEVAALLKLMGLRGLADTSVEPAMPDGAVVQSLIESGAVMVCGDRTLVDRTISLVLTNAAGGGVRLSAAGAEGRAVLYRGERMYVLAEESGELVTLEPLQNQAAARGPFLAAAGRLTGPVLVRLTGRDGLSREGEGPQAYKAYFEHMEIQ